MGETFEIPLDIPGVKIEKVELNQAGDFVITVSSTVEGTCCHRCGERITKPYGHGQVVTLRHLPILGRRTYLRLRPLRYQCPHCSGGPTTTQKLPWYEPRSPHTKAYEQYVLFELVNSTVADVSAKQRLGYEAVMGIIDRHIETQVNWKELKALGILGIDEVALKKGHRDFVTIITCRVKGEIRLLAVLPDRKKATVKAFLSSIPRRLRRTIQTVCSDMYEGYVKAAREVLGRRMQIVTDRFHVAKLYRQGMDKLRQQELKRLRQELPKEDYQQLKGAMWALRKDKAQLSQEELAVLACLFICSPLLKMAYDFCHELTAIFDQDLTRAAAIKQINQWKRRVKRSPLRCFNDFLTTLDNHLEEIANYFEGRFTSGFVEGFNNKIKVIKRRCYGILNVDHLFQRIHLDLMGRTLFA